MLRVRLIDAGDAEVRAVAAALALDLRKVDTGEPDLTLRYADDATAGSEGFDVKVDGVGILVGRSAGGTMLHCTYGQGLPRLVSQLAALCAVEAAAMPVHAVGFAMGGRGFVVTGQSGAGKTAVLLAALRRRARLVAAEHILVTADGALHGRPEAVRVRPRHRHQLAPELRRTFGRRLIAWESPVAAARAVAQSRYVPARVSTRLVAAVRDRAWVDVPARAFSCEGCEGDVATAPPQLDTLAVLLPTPGLRELQFRSLSPQQAAVRLRVLFREELTDVRRAADAATMVTGVADPWSLTGSESAYGQLAAGVLNGRTALLVHTPPGELSETAARQIVDRVLGGSR